MNTFWSTAYEAQNNGIDIRHNNSFWMTESAGIRYLKELKYLSTQFQMKQYLNKNHHHPIFLLPLSYFLQKLIQSHIIALVSQFTKRWLHIDMLTSHLTGNIEDQKSTPSQILKFNSKPKSSLMKFQPRAANCKQLAPTAGLSFGREYRGYQACLISLYVLLIPCLILNAI